VAPSLRQVCQLRHDFVGQQRHAAPIALLLVPPVVDQLEYRAEAAHGRVQLLNPARHVVWTAHQPQVVHQPIDGDRLVGQPLVGLEQEQLFGVRQEREKVALKDLGLGARACLTSRLFDGFRDVDIAGDAPLSALRSAASLADAWAS
jgi:hypothetical protein